LCPAFGRGCYGCFGPREQANTGALASAFGEDNRSPAEVARLFAGFTVGAPAFRRQVEQELKP
jgi:hypothetical protein